MAEANLQNNGGEGNGQSIQEKYGRNARTSTLYDEFTLCLGPLENAIDKLGSYDDEFMGEAAILYAAYRHAYDSLREMILVVEEKFGRLSLVLAPDQTLFYHGFKAGDVLGVEIQQPVTEQQDEQGVDHD